MTTRRRLDLRDDRGVTLVELVVAMMIMAIVMVLSTGAVSMAFDAGQQVDSSTSAQTQTSIAYDRLDKAVRYAIGLSDAGSTANGDPDVELLVKSSTGAPTCTQLRLDRARGQLRIRTWTVNGAAPASTDWTVLTSGVTTISAGGGGARGTSSFAVLPPDQDHVYQRLTVSLVVTSGTNANQASTSSGVTFDAVNTNLATTTSSAATCTSVGRSAP